MSDEPKPTTVKEILTEAFKKPTFGEAVEYCRNSKPTTGEWTAETVDGIARSGLSPWQDVADAHNAALAAEREKVNHTKSYHQSLERTIQQLREQRDEAIRLLEYKEKQLAASQAAMKEAIEQPYHVDAYRILEEALNGDTAALDAAIDAAQKPLLDALTKAADTFTDLEIGLRLLGKRDIAKACEIADEETRKALAKAKEGK